MKWLNWHMDSMYQSGTQYIMIWIKLTILWTIHKIKAGINIAGINRDKKHFELYERVSQKLNEKYIYMVCRDDWCSVWSSCMSMTSTVIQFHLIVVSVTGPRWGFPYILCLHSFSTHYPTYINFLLEIFLIRMNRLDHVSNMREVEFVTFVLQCIQSSYDMCND